MPFYQYQAKSPDGKIVSDKIEAADQSAAVNALTTKGFLITSIEEAKENGDVMDVDLNFFNRRISGETISTFLIQLSIIINGVCVKYRSR